MIRGSRVEMLVTEFTGRPDVRNGMPRHHRDAVVGPPADVCDGVAVALEGRGGKLGQLRGLGLLEAHHVRSGPLEEAPDGLEPRSERVQVPGRHSQVPRGRPGG